jgi:hypothetical protein
MIRPLIIGTPEQVEYYERLIQSLSYFRFIQKLIALDESDTLLPDLNSIEFDAVIFACSSPLFYSLAMQLAKSRIPVYFPYQQNLSPNQLNDLEKTLTESEGIFFHETLESEHPILQDFTGKQHRNLKIDFLKSVSGKIHFNEAIRSALLIVSALSSMPIKRFNFNTFTPNNFAQNGIHLQVQLFDHSECNIKVWIHHAPFHQITIQSSNGKFLFDLEKSYIENSHGIQFPSKKITNDDLRVSLLEKFALCIFLQKQPAFTFQHFAMIHNTLNSMNQFLF